jgi:hypothetical protein
LIRFWTAKIIANFVPASIPGSCGAHFLLAVQRRMPIHIQRYGSPAQERYDRTFPTIQDAFFNPTQRSLVRMLWLLRQLEWPPMRRSVLAANDEWYTVTHHLRVMCLDVIGHILEIQGAKIPPTRLEKIINRILDSIHRKDTPRCVSEGLARLSETIERLDRQNPRP